MSSLAIDFDTLYVDATDVRRNGRLIITDGVVTDIQPRSEDQQTTEPDLRASCLIPGLINAHVHLEQNAGADTVGYFRDSRATGRAIVAAEQARRTLLSGVTAVRDLGSSEGIAVEVRNAVSAGSIVGPTIRTVARAICMTGGHGWFVGRQADGPDDLRRAVREQLAAGADCIKLIATGGVLTPGAVPGQEQLSADELNAAVDEAHRHNLKVAAHAIGTQGIINAARAGVDSIEHGFLIDDEGIDLLVEHRIALVPTLAALLGIVEAGTAAGLPDFVSAKAAALNEHGLANLRRAREAGVRFVAGSDAGTPFNPHHGFGHELELMHSELGLSGTEVLRAATAEAAELLGTGTGRLTLGSPADLVGYDTDVVSEASFGTPPRFVVKNGVHHAP